MFIRVVTLGKLCKRFFTRNISFGQQTLNVLAKGKSYEGLYGDGGPLKSSPSPCSACCRLFATRSKDHEDMAKVRNIGIIAHIDAGKTTTTERMLYYSGFAKHLGDVDRGDTVMDYMEQERDRGITINSAAITFHWNHHKVNLIDTPGHVDFTMEVERTLRVMDGAVAVLDASAGVEAQTMTVWQQAENYNVPCIVYLNKMDKRGASIEYCLHTLREKLHVCPLLLHLPLGVESDFTGVVDLVQFTSKSWDPSKSFDGQSFTSKPLSQSGDLEVYNKAVSARAAMIGQLADHDECIADLVLGEVKLEDISDQDLVSAIRRVTLSRKMIPVLCGSSLKNKGVQPLLDSIISYLPSPKDIKYGFAEYYGTDLCAFAFKVLHDPQRGPLTYLRLYSGSVNSGATIYNINRGTTEKISRILQIYADELQDVSRAVNGNIVAVAGIKQTFTGDTLTTSHSTAKSASKAWHQEQHKNKNLHHQKENQGLEEGEDAATVSPVLAGINVPAPVFFCSIEPPSMAYQKRLEQALMCLQKEDPSLKMEVNPETGQTILSGMGELHLDIIQSRIHKEYGIEVDLGPLQIAYRETITQEADVSEVLDKTLGDRQHFVQVRMSVKPDPNTAHIKQVELVRSQDNSMQHLRPQQLKAINNAVKLALANGPILGFPLIHVSVSLHEFQSRPGTSLAMVAACVVQCLNHALKQAGPQLLEPMMELEISTDEDSLHSVLDDLGHRRSHVNKIQNRQTRRLIEALAPLEELKGYSTDLRTVSSGRASFTMQLSRYQQMGLDEEKRVIQKVTGFTPV